MCTWGRSRSSHKVISRQYGNATIAQLDSHISGQQLCIAEKGGAQCPYCRSKLVCLHNSLATVAPEVAQYWSHSKNNKTPEQVLAGSNFRAHWKCPTRNWEWEAEIKHRTRRRAGCPKCSLAQRVCQLQPTFAEAQPAELSQ